MVFEWKLYLPTNSIRKWHFLERGQKTVCLRTRIFPSCLGGFELVLFQLCGSSPACYGDTMIPCGQSEAFLSSFCGDNTLLVAQTWMHSFVVFPLVRWHYDTCVQKVLLFAAKSLSLVLDFGNVWQKTFIVCAWTHSFCVFPPVRWHYDSGVQQVFCVFPPVRGHYDNGG